MTGNRGGGGGGGIYTFSTSLPSPPAHPADIAATTLELEARHVGHETRPGHGPVTLAMEDDWPMDQSGVSHELSQEIM